MKTPTIIALGVLGFATISISSCILRPILYPVKQANRIYEKTLDADNVIYNYEYFKQQYQDILAVDIKINTAKSQLNSFLEISPRKDWDYNDKQEYSRLSTNISGLQNVRNEMIAVYNARANMVNRKIFMGRDVPSQINQE